MNTPKNTIDSTWFTGLVLLIISAILYTLPDIIVFNEDSFLGLFSVNYIITVAYFIFLLVKKKFKRGGDGMPAIFLFLVLFLISAYSLNRELPVFERSVEWLSVMLVTAGVCYVAIAYYERFPVWLKHLHTFLLGVSFILFLYLSIYLLPLCAISTIAVIFLGISLHSFVPLLFVLFSIRHVYRSSVANSSYVFIFGAGAAAAVIVAVIFAVSWANLNKTVTATFQKSLITDDTDLPSWVTIAENVHEGSLTEKYLKYNMVYTVPSGNWDWGMPGGTTFDEVRKHDPLIMIAALFSKPPSINREDRIKILESIYDARHKTLTRLRSGDDLETQAVITNVRLWPESRIAYTEKTITVFSNEGKQRWNREHEAIYTFYLPEGGVVTSLSLWIEGKEEKARLTTKSKADSAYNEIVGVQRRDPSVVHWQEGNTVSVRVFPILTSQNRIFKIGITAPMQKKGDELVYENIYFRGPDATEAQETRQVDWVGAPHDMKMPAGYKTNGNDRFIMQTTYDPSWNLRCSDAGITKGSFYFDGHTYAIQPYTPQYKRMYAQQIYADINRSWTSSEVQAIYELSKKMPVYVYADELILLNERTKDILTTLQELNFSLFPFYKVKDNAHSIVITKCTGSAPNLGDLKGSSFAEKLEEKLSSSNPLNLYNLGSNLSPYLKTLKEYRAFNYATGDMSMLNGMLDKLQFPENIESSELVVVDNADVVLTKTADTTNSSAPDHLMRLFAYNHLMHEMGTSVFTNRESDEVLVREAEQAFIVSPVSSLVVLETQADYDRFGIEENKNSLENASLKSTGAVPEPHEWALILVVCGVLLWYTYRSRLKHGRS